VNVLSLGIKGKFIVGFDGEKHRLLRDGLVIIEGNKIKYVGKTFSGQVDRWIDASRSLVMPGFIDTHYHGSQANKSYLEDVGNRALYMSNMGGGDKPRFDPMNKEERETFAKYSFIDSLKSGCTTVVALWFFDSLNEMKAVDLIDDMGVRVCLGWGMNDGAWAHTQAANVHTEWLGLETGIKMLERATNFIEKYRNTVNGRLMPILYPLTVDLCSAEFQKMVRVRADELKVPISIHAGETVFEFQNMLRMYGQTSVEFMRNTGLLGSDLIIAHGWAISGHPWVVYPPVDGGDLRLLAEAEVTVSHNPLVFAWRGIMMHSHSKYLKAGVNVSIGTDFAPQDMLNQMRIGSYVTKLADGSCYSGSSKEIFTSATLGGAKGIGRSDLGRITPDALADIVIVNMESLNTVPVRDPIKNLVNHANRSDVQTVIVDGKILVEEGKVLNVDEEKLIKKVQKISEKRWREVSINDPQNRTMDYFSPQSLKPWKG